MFLFIFNVSFIAVPIISSRCCSHFAFHLVFVVTSYIYYPHQMTLHLESDQHHVLKAASVYVCHKSNKYVYCYIAITLYRVNQVFPPHFQTIFFYRISNIRQTLSQYKHNHTHTQKTYFRSSF